jgi:hypothetical protein
MDHAVLVCVTHRSAHLEEQLDASRDIEPPYVAVTGQRQAVDVFDDDVRFAVRRRAGVVDGGDVGMAHQRERLSLGFETSNDQTALDVGTYDLERHSTLDR